MRPRRVAPVTPPSRRSRARSHFARAPPGELWHASDVRTRTLLVAALLAAVGLGSAAPASAQLWKPKKKPATAAPAPRKSRPAVRKKPVRRKPANAVVHFQPPPRDDDDDRPSSDRADQAEVDDNPIITVVDGDRDE